MESYLKNLLLEEIPLTHALGIEVLSSSPTLVRLSAPLENNINHKLTAFGGSLYCVAVLSCWALLHLQLKHKDIQAHVVIQDGNMKYKRPVTSDIVSECRLETGSPIEKILATVERKGRARITLHSVIEQAGKMAVQFEGRFVIHR